MSKRRKNMKKRGKDGKKRQERGKGSVSYGIIEGTGGKFLFAAEGKRAAFSPQKAVRMSVTDFFVASERYGADVLLVALIVALCVEVLRRVLPAKIVRAPVFHLIPPLLGAALFAGYYALSHGSIGSIAENPQYFLERGVAVSCVSVAENALFSRLLGETDLSERAAIVRELLLEEIGEKTEEVAQKIADAVSLEYSEEDVRRTEELLREYSPATSEECARLLARRIVETLKTTA